MVRAAGGLSSGVTGTDAMEVTAVMIMAAAVTGTIGAGATETTDARGTGAEATTSRRGGPEPSRMD